MKINLKTVLFIFLVAFFATFSNLQAADPQPTGRIPDTGQTTSYTETFGEDADYLINPPSYTKLDASGNDLPEDATAWVMVRDNITGLIWEVKTDDGSIHDRDDTYSLNSANDFIENLNTANYGGHDDWRMPTVMELSLLINLSRYAPTISVDFFPHCQADRYHSSTTNVINTSNTWVAQFYHGLAYNTRTKTEAQYVRAVRSVPTCSIEPLKDNEDGTVTDPNTGLMWQQAEAGSMNWESAINICEALELVSYDDWRLPNQHELQSLVNYNLCSPCLDTALFPNVSSDYYWASSTFPYDQDIVALIDFGEGDIYTGTRTDSHYVRSVRAGQPWSLDHLYIANPAQASFWNPGEVMAITWETRDLVGDVKISLSRDGGKTYTEIDPETSKPNNGSYNWTVTAPDSVNCTLKIEPLSDLEKATVQGLFTIKTHVNQAPEINPAIPNQSANEGDPVWTVDLSSYESDTEDSGAELTWSVSGVDTSLFTAEISDATSCISDNSSSVNSRPQD